MKTCIFGAQNSSLFSLMPKPLSIHRVRLFFTTIRHVKNWPTYFIELFGLMKKKERIYRTRDGLQYYVRTNTTDRSIVNSVAIQDEYQMKKLGLRDATILDLGGQNGYFSVFASKYARRIFTFEPIPENYRNILLNISLNGLENTVTVFNLAVLDEKKTINIYLSENTGGHSIYAAKKKKQDFLEVETTTLPDIFQSNHIETCDLLKLDIEGSEYDILYNLPDAYFKKILNIRMEVHRKSREGGNYEALAAFLREKQYRILQYENFILFAQRIDLP